MENKKNTMSMTVFEKKLEKSYSQYLINKAKSDKRGKEIYQKIEPAMIKEEIKKMKKFIESEKSLYPKKLELAKKIFKWKNDLLKMDISRRMLDAFWQEIRLYDGKCGHRKCESYMKNPRSSLKIKKKNLWYEFWWGTSSIDIPLVIEINLKTAHEMAKKLSYDFLSEVWRFLDSGITSRWLIKQLRRSGKW